MPTVITRTVKPSGGDFTLLSTALASVPADIVAVDEQWDIECDTFVGGLNEQVTVPAIVQDATRYVHIKAAAGHEYDPVTDTGFIIRADVAFGAPLTVGAVADYTRLSNIGMHNLRTLGSSRGLDGQSDFSVFIGLFATSDGASGALVYNLNQARSLIIENCISYKGTTGFTFINGGTRSINKITSIDATEVGISNGSADSTITNSLSMGSPDPYTGTFNAASDFNASDGTDAPDNGNSLQNRTTADLADYAGGDFRTASGSALATAGSVDFIGYDLEAGAGGLTISPTSIPSEEAWGTPSLSFDQTIEPASIPSEEAWGTPTVQPAGVTISPASIPSEEAWGTPSMQIDQFIFPTGIPSEEVWGIPVLSDGTALIIPPEFRITHRDVAIFLEGTGRFVSKRTNDIIYEWMLLEGVQGVQYNDMFYDYLESQGFQGTYSDKQKEWRGVK